MCNFHFQAFFQRQNVVFDIILFQSLTFLLETIIKSCSAVYLSLSICKASFFNCCFKILVFIPIENRQTLLSFFCNGYNLFERQTYWCEEEFSSVSLKVLVKTWSLNRKFDSNLSYVWKREKSARVLKPCTNWTSFNFVESYSIFNRLSAQASFSLDN